MEQTNNHGGARRNAGRKTERHDLEVTKQTVSYDETTKRRLAVLGGGNVSKGIRLAAQFAYEGYQAGRLKLPA